MFCKQCGKRIEAGIRQCPYCGRVPDVLSGGTGFWNLTQTSPAATPAAPPVQQPPVAQTIPTVPPVVRPVNPVPPMVEKPPVVPPMLEELGEPQMMESRGSGRILPLIFGVVMVIMLVAIIILSVKVSKLNDKLDAAQAALIAQEEDAEAPEEPPVAEAPVVDASVQEETIIEEMPEEPPEASPIPSEVPEEAPAEEPAEEPEESPEPSETPEVPAEPAPLVAELSRNWDSITLEVDAGELEVESYEWVVVYDPTLETVEECLKVLDKAAVEENEEIRRSFISQVDPYDGSVDRPQQKIPVSEFYQSSDTYVKRMFCKMTLENGEIYCSDIIYPILVATEGYVTLQQVGDAVTATVVSLPATMTNDEISCFWLEVDPVQGTEQVLEALPYAEGLAASITMGAEKRYYYAMEKEGIRIITTEPLVLETQNRVL